MSNNFNLMPTAWQNNNNQQTKTSNSVIVNYQPEELRLVENNLSFKFSPIVQNANPNKSKLIVRVVGNIPQDTKFKIETPFTTIILNASTSPTFNEFITSSNSGATYQMNTAEAIARKLLNSQLLLNYYNVWTVNNEIHIEAKSFGNNDIIFTAIPAPTFTTTNFQVVLNQSGTNKYVVDELINYQMFADIFIVNGDYGTVVDKSNATYVNTLYFPFKLDLDTNLKTVEFNINNLINDYLDVTLPTRRADTLQSLVELDKQPTPKHMIAYFIVWGDSYRFQRNGERTQVIQGVSNIRWVQNGGLDSLTPYDLSQYVWFNQITPFKFLTRCPNEKEVSYNSIEFLQFIRKKQSNLTVGYEYGRTIEYTFIDGSNITINQVIGNNWINLSNNISLDVSPSNINLQGIEVANGLLVDRYRISFWYKVNPTSTLQRSEWKTYKVRRKCNEQSYNLLFINRLGAWDTLEFRGESEVSVDKSSINIERNSPIITNTDSTISYDQILTNKINYSKTYTVNTGFIYKTHYSWTSEILSSPAVYLWNEELRKWQAVIIDTSSYSFNSKDDEFNLSITFKFAYSEQTITR